MICCPKCGNEISENISFCANCGCNLKQQLQPEETAAECSYCATPIYPGETYCRACGKNFARPSTNWISEPAIRDMAKADNDASGKAAASASPVKIVTKRSEAAYTGTAQTKSSDPVIKIPTIGYYPNPLFQSVGSIEISKERLRFTPLLVGKGHSIEMISILGAEKCKIMGMNSGIKVKTAADEYVYNVGIGKNEMIESIIDAIMKYKGVKR